MRRTARQQCASRRSDPDKDEIKREMHDPVIEVGTPICRNVTRLRGEIIRLARENGMRMR